jgi:hypothetical protein
MFTVIKPENWNDSLSVQNQLPLSRRCSETANKIKAAYRNIHSTEQTDQNVHWLERVSLLSQPELRPKYVVVFRWLIVHRI